MLISFVLRLVAEGLDRGVVAGEVHVVGSGERVLVHDHTELLSVLRGDRGRAPRAEEKE